MFIDIDQKLILGTLRLSPNVGLLKSDEIKRAFGKPVAAESQALRI
jgi:hypothetical protein